MKSTTFFSGVFIANFEHISHLFLVFLLLLWAGKQFLNIIAKVLFVERWLGTGLGFDAILRFSFIFWFFLGS